MSEALAAFRARWAHEPLDVRDVEERVALRFRDDDAPPEIRAVAAAPAVRLFLARRVGDWRSCYLHAVADVDRALDHLRSVA